MKLKKIEVLPTALSLSIVWVVFRAIAAILNLLPSYNFILFESGGLAEGESLAYLLGYFFGTVIRGFISAFILVVVLGYVYNFVAKKIVSVKYSN